MSCSEVTDRSPMLGTCSVTGATSDIPDSWHSTGSGFCFCGYEVNATISQPGEILYSLSRGAFGNGKHTVLSDACICQ